MGAACLWGRKGQSVAVGSRGSESGCGLVGAWRGCGVGRFMSWLWGGWGLTQHGCGADMLVLRFGVGWGHSPSDRLQAWLCGVGGDAAWLQGPAGTVGHPHVPATLCPKLFVLGVWGGGGGGHLKHFQPIENPRSTDIISLWADRLAAWPGPDTAAQHP